MYLDIRWLSTVGATKLCQGASFTLGGPMTVTRRNVLAAGEWAPPWSWSLLEGRSLWLQLRVGPGCGAPCLGARARPRPSASSFSCGENSTTNASARILVSGLL